MTRPPVFVHTTESLNYAVTHVFLPVRLPEEDDYTLEKELSLARAVCAAAHAYTTHVSGTSEEDRWRRITKMLDNLQASIRSERLDNDHIISQLRGAQTGDVLAFFIRPQNAAAIFTKRENCTLCETFEVSPSEDAVKETAGSLICSYPSSAVEVPNEVFDDEDFQIELTNFLSRPYTVNSESDLSPPPARPQYITVVLNGILRGVGYIADVPRITKRIRDDVGRPRGASLDIWRRSSLWLLIRIAIQTVVDRSSLGRASYKQFMLYFMCTVARDEKDAELPCDLLSLISCKILRRLTKLGPSVPPWLSEMALETCDGFRRILDFRWKQSSTRQSLFRNPSQSELERDTQCLLENSREYIRKALTKPDPEPPNTPFHPSHHRRGTIEDFLSLNGSFFEEAYRVDPDITLHDVDRSVEQGIDSWVAHVTNVDEACTQLEILMDRYLLIGRMDHRSPDKLSIRVLTGIELYVALDKLVTREIPMLSDYPPEIPITLLERLVLWKETSLHRLACAYQYLSARHSQSRPGWSVLPNEFTEDSFPVRYYDQSQHLQQLKTRIEQDAADHITGHAGLEHISRSCLVCIHEHPAGQRLSESTERLQSPLPTSLVRAKAVVFELQCPLSIRTWRSAAARILWCFDEPNSPDKLQEPHLIAHVPALHPYFVGRQESSLCSQVHLSHFYQNGSQFQSSPTLRYVIGYTRDWKEDSQRLWRRYDSADSKHLSHWHNSWIPHVGSASRTSNDIFAKQADCPANLSLDEFIALAHTRSGGSLQWLNILWGLRSRTLHLRHPVAYIFIKAAFQVGPLDLHTGMWIWHQELKDASFCNALVDELDSLFSDVGIRSIDAVLMGTISLLVTRLLASSPGEDVSARVISLLRSVRRRTFGWVQALSYDLAMEATNEKRQRLLLEMAATCRTTFDVEPSILCKTFHSAEDVDAVLSCALFIYAFRFQTKYMEDHLEYSNLLSQQEKRLSATLEEVLRDVFASYRPVAHRWEPLEYPNDRWLTCKTKASENQPSQALYINLFDGSLQMGSRSLPHEIWNSEEFQLIFGRGPLLVSPSDLPGMDLMTLAVTSRYKVHFSMRHDNLVVWAQCNRTNEVLELIPSTKLENDLPPVLIDDHVHWLNLSTKIIEIRHFGRLWEESSENWKIDCASGEYHVYRRCEILVDIGSPTWEMVFKCFECFRQRNILARPVDIVMEPSRNFLITASPVNSVQSTPVLRLSVALLHYGLSFFVNEMGELESLDFKDMIYDEDQCIGALFGLENLLVLRPKTYLTQAEALIRRRVLIPYGFPRSSGNLHTRIYVDRLNRCQHSDPPLYHVYDVDTDLGCLIGNGSLTSTRLLAYLHASTTCYRLDPLTGKIGTQTALYLLQSRGCRSAMKSRRLSSDSSLAGTDGNGPWSSTQYPQINILHKKIQDGYFNGIERDGLLLPSEKRAAQRAIHLFPSNITVPISSEVGGDMECLVPESDLELEDIVFAVASAVQRWPIDAPTICDWVGLWSGVVTCADTAPPLLDDNSGAKLNPDLVQTLIIKVRNLLKKREESRLQCQLLFLLPTMAYCSPSRQTAFLSMLNVFAMRVQSHLGIPPTLQADCKISDGYRPTENVLRHHIQRFLLEKPWRPDSELKGRVKTAVKHLLQGWPSDITLMVPVPLDSDYWDVAGLTVSLRQLFASCYRNFNLKERLIRILAGPDLSIISCRVSPVQYIFNEQTQWQVTLDQLFSTHHVPELPPRSFLPCDILRGNETSVPPLHQLFSSFQTNSVFQRDYLALLETSAGVHHMTRSLAAKDYIDTLQKHYAHCRVNYTDALGILKEELGPMTYHERLLEQFGQWPPITPDVLLRCLVSTSVIKPPGSWKKCLISFALLLLELQRARRLLRCALAGLEEELLKGLEDEQCDGWNPEEYPDWLLIQVEGDFLIRRAQAETAMELMSPRTGENSVMQVNMGEGKSSVIIPIAAAALADGKQLLRIVVPKALTVQMFDLLVARLGGLTNRPVYHLPFSRPKYNDYRDPNFRIDYLHEIMSRCMVESGIILAQPEHVASLKLMSVEQHIPGGKLAINPQTKHQISIYKYIRNPLLLRLLPEDSLVGSIFRWLSQSPSHSKTKDDAHANPHDSHGGNTHSPLDNASKLVELQEWLHSHTRDILDESDEVLHSRFQLIYTIGFEQHMEGYPDRWTITQQVLRLAKDRVRTISKNHPNDVEYECGPPGSFPRIHIVRASDVGSYLISSIVEDVMAGRLPNFNFQRIPSVARDAIRSFISDENVLQIPDTVRRVEEYAQHSDQSYLWNGLLVLRGLLSSNILLFALAERRWRVDYGLGLGLVSRWQYDPASAGETTTTTMLAVPYRAKDVPALNTQFGHPDLTILFTCLSYYYTGLTKEQLRLSFETLFDQDEPSAEYTNWVEEYDRELESLPGSLWKLREINIRSSEQWDKVIFPLFSRNKATIDFYLSRVVFPKEAKEFPSKLSASSWDLGEKREKLVTGFSGTNDGRWLLPTSVTQIDLHHQRGTNAIVLGYLLQPENDFYMVTHGSGKWHTTPELLRLVAIQQPEIRVLLDVGAQILDLSNRQVAEAWLDIVRDTSGVIYFDENDELMALTRNGLTQLLSSSPFSKYLDRCLVYLDHAHTRGTDLNFPVGSRGAVTLGPKVTKDSLVQGCMRMRKLGRGHSVMFFAPLGIDQSIRAVTGKKDPNTRITTADILRWAIHETWTDIQQRAPYWAQQGMNHKMRYEAWSRFCNNELTPEQLSGAWVQKEARSLADLYAPKEAKDLKSDLSDLDPAIRQRCKDIGVLSLPSAQMEEEQEREVNREREREREVELPPRAKPAKHFLHPDVVTFVKTGVIPPLQSGSAFLPVFTTLEKSSAATRDANVWSPFILATADFSKTVDPESTEGTLDQYLRPVQWILSSRRAEVLVVLSPFEGDKLMADIRNSEHVHLHLYAPRTSKRMKPSDDLRLYSIPPLPSDWTPPWDLIDQLNVFAGQLYLRDYTSYLRLCRFLCVPTEESSNDTTRVRRNLFNIPGSLEEMEIMFSGSPLPSVMALLAIRNRGRPFAHTHMGRILQGQFLTEKDFKGPMLPVSDQNPTIYEPQELETAGMSEANLRPLQERLRTDW